MQLAVFFARVLEFCATAPLAFDVEVLHDDVFWPLETAAASTNLFANFPFVRLRQEF